MVSFPKPRVPKRISWHRSLNLAYPNVPPPAYSELKGEEVRPEDVTILCRCPRSESYMWMVSLYSTVCGGCGSILSFLWLVGHLYVLLQTEDSELQTQR